MKTTLRIEPLLSYWKNAIVGKIMKTIFKYILMNFQVDVFLPKYLLKYICQIHNLLVILCFQRVLESLVYLTFFVLHKPDLADIMFLTVGIYIHIHTYIYIYLDNSISCFCF